MARIRSLKPEFPQSETIGALSRDARLLFIQLWTLVDDEGRARAASRMLASLLYPYDDDAPKLMEKWLSELEVEKCIRRYEVEGNSYLEIVNWLKHQKIDRPSPSRLPPYREPSANPREPSRALDADLGPRIKDKDQGSEDAADAASTDRSFSDSPSPLARSGKSYAFESGIIRLKQKDFDQWKRAYSHLDLAAELLSLTKWAGEQGPENWFFAVSGALTKKNRELGLRLEQNKSDGLSNDEKFFGKGRMPGVV